MRSSAQIIALCDTLHVESTEKSMEGLITTLYFSALDLEITLSCAKHGPPASCIKGSVTRDSCQYVAGYVLDKDSGKIRPSSAYSFG